MSKRSRTKLVPLIISPSKKEIFETAEEIGIEEQGKGLLNCELNNEADCPRCNDIMELQSSFDRLLYWCNNCGFQLKCV